MNPTSASLYFYLPGEETSSQPTPPLLPSKQLPPSIVRRTSATLVVEEEAQQKKILSQSRFFPLPFQKIGLTATEADNIYHYIMRKEGIIFPRLKRSGETAILRRNITRLAYSLLFTPKEEIYILFKSKNKTFPFQSYGSFKKIKPAWEYSTGKLRIQSTLPISSEDSKRYALREKFIYELTEGRRGFVKIYNFCSYLCKRKGIKKISTIMHYYNEKDLFEYTGKIFFNSMGKLISKEERESFLLPIAIKVCNALSYLHRANVLHRDLKSENLFVDKREDGSIDVVIGDYNLASLPNDFGRNSSVVGDPVCMAPEMMEIYNKIRGFSQNKRAVHPITDKSDIWGIATTFYSLLFQTIPPWGTDYAAACQDEDRRAYDITDQMGEWFPEPLNDPFLHILWEALNPLPTKRPTAAELVQKFRALESRKRKGVIPSRL